MVIEVSGNREEIAKFTIGVDLGGSKIGAALVNNSGDITEYIKSPTNAQQGKDVVINRIKETIKQLINQSGVNVDNISGIGIGVPGQLDARTGIVYSAPNLPGWKEVPICRIIEEEFQLTVALENDANVAAWGEKIFGVAKGVKDMICLTLGTGIGGGLIFNGKIYHGNKFAAGEVGHIIVNKDGPPCNCGGYGCLETYSSATGIRDRISDKVKKLNKNKYNSLSKSDIDNISLSDIFKRARQGDPLVKDIVEDAIEYLGVGITILVNLLNPKMIVLVGGIANEGDKLLVPVKNYVFGRAMKIMLEDLQIVLGKLKGQAGVLGAAALLCSSDKYQ
jgi:glucokinase